MARAPAAPLPEPANAATDLAPPRDGWQSRRVRRPLPSAAKVARKRAQQRWSALLTANSSRLAREMRGALGEEHWSQLVLHASQYKRAFVKAFDPLDARLPCIGKSGGSPCPRSFDLCESASTLRQLELDHEHDLQVTCDLWRNQRPVDAGTWSAGVQDASLLCHLLFGVRAHEVHGPPSVRFRCHSCHARNLPHYRSLRSTL